MQNEEQMTPAERELETALHQLRPSTTGIDPLSMAFQAGRRAGRRSLQLWRGAATTFAIALVAVSMQTFHHSPLTADRSIALQTFAEDQQINLADARLSYAEIRTQVLEHGIAAMPSQHSVGSSGIIYRAGDSLPTVE